MTSPRYMPGSPSTISSPTMSVWSRGHSQQSSGSVNSVVDFMPIRRDSFDMYGTSSKLENVREEDDIYLSAIGGHSSLDGSIYDDFKSGVAYAGPVSPVNPDYALGDQDAWSTSCDTRGTKRQRSFDKASNRVSSGLTTRLGSSIQRRWRNRSGAAPQLSIITSPIPTTSPRNSIESSQCRTANTTNQSYYKPILRSPISMRSLVGQVIEEVPIFMEQEDQIPPRENEDQARATTPLLPPAMLHQKRCESPLQSPLQSPAIAPVHQGHMMHSSLDQPFLAYLPSPPLSTKPSLISIPRTRANTIEHHVQPLSLANMPYDAWSDKLGHADFHIQPYPYLPEIIDMENFKLFRNDWEGARRQYIQHKARTIEHYGSDSKVMRLTEQKWLELDAQWKVNDEILMQRLRPELAQLEKQVSISELSSHVLERPASRVHLPHLDMNGKFAGLGDQDIVGPMSVGIAKVPELQRGLSSPPMSPRNRNLSQFLREIFNKH